MTNVMADELGPEQREFLDAACEIADRSEEFRADEDAFGDTRDERGKGSLVRGTRSKRPAT